MSVMAETIIGAYDEHVTDVYRFCGFRTGNTSLGQHLTGETFREALRREKVPAPAVQGPWLIRVARAQIAEHAQRWPQERPAVDLDAGPQDLELLGFMHQLADHQQDVLILRHLMGFTVEQTALAMGRTERSVCILQSVAARALARKLPRGWRP